MLQSNVVPPIPYPTWHYINLIKLHLEVLPHFPRNDFQIRLEQESDWLILEDNWKY